MPAPILQALLLAERVYEDKRSSSKIIAGTFSRITISRTPQQPQPGAVPPPDMGSPFAYMNLTDVIDGTQVKLQLMNVSENKMILEYTVNLRSQDRLAANEVVIPLPPLRTVMQQPGTYSLDALWGNEPLGSHRIIVAEAPPPQPPPQEF